DIQLNPFGYALRRSSFALMSRNKFGINGRSKKSSLNKNLLNFPCSALGEKNSPSNFIFCIKFFMAQTVFLRLRFYRRTFEAAKLSTQVPKRSLRGTQIFIMAFMNHFVIVRLSGCCWK